VVQVLCPSLVGRQAELAELGELIAGPDESRRGVVVVSGEAGIGKSRLARELAEQARTMGLRVLWGRAVQSVAPIPYRPFAEAVHAGLGRREFEALVSGPDRVLLRALLDADDQPPAAPATSVLPVLEAIRRLLIAAAEGGDLLLVVEDLHWADPETLATVEYLADNLNGSHALCLCTLRTDAGGPAEALVEDLVARRSCPRIGLSPLSAGDVAEMTRRCLRVEAVPPSLLDTLRTRAAGVPFLVEEMISAYVDAGGPADQQPEWWISRRIAEALPASYRAVVAERLERLSEEHRAVTSAAAVLGRTFDWRLLGAATGLGDQAVLGALRTAMRAHIVAAAAEHYAGSFEFRHALAREAILAELLPTERADVSLRLAREIERAFPGVPGEWCERAADLSEQGGDRLGAARLLQECGRRALNRSAFDSAERALLRARGLCEDDWMVWMGVDDLLLDVYAAAGRTEAVAELGQRLADTFEARYPGKNRDSRVGGIHLRVARGLIPFGDWPVVRSNLEQARICAGAVRDERLMTYVAALDAHVTLQSGDSAAALALAIAAGEQAARLGLVDGECEALAARAAAELREGDVDAAQDSYALLAQQARGPSLVVWRIQGLLGLGVIDRVARGAVAHLAEARELAASVGAVALLAAIDLEIARAHLGRAELDRARAPLAEALEAARRYGLALLADALAAECMCHALSADVRAVAAAAAGAQGVLGVSHPEVVASGAAVLALVQGDDAAALARLDEACAEADPPSDEGWLELRALLGVAVVGDTGRLEQVRERGLPAGPTARAYVGYAAAICAGLAGRTAEADALMESADVLMPPGWRRHHARRLVAEAAVRDGWGDPTGWAVEGLEFFDASVLPRLADACRATLRKAGVPLRRRGRGESEVPRELYRLGVTSREIDVLRLVAERMSNREIGELLFVSPRTVETHVASLLRKVSVGTRAELVEVGRRYRGD
jgi:DNA-binding CsgD family transcriptional regulator/tetratricopeptide (TPR) repeat protein